MAKEKPLKLEEFEVEGKKYRLKPVKMKDIKNGFYDDFLFLFRLGFVRTLSYADGEEILFNFLEAVCEDKKHIQTIAENLTAKSMNEILEKVKKMNEIEHIEDLLQEKNE